MWLTSSSIGRKVVMSVTGACLVLFLTFHMLMNLVYVYDVMVGTPAGGHYYDKVCEFLGTNWYALLGTAGLALLVVIHFIYAFILTFQNRKARGNDPYAISGKQPVHWAAKNMLVLGIIVICGILVHLYNFWANMMFAELAGIEGAYAPAAGFDWITNTLCDPILSPLIFVTVVALFAMMMIPSKALVTSVLSEILRLAFGTGAYILPFVLVLIAAVVQAGGFHSICC